MSVPSRMDSNITRLAREAGLMLVDKPEAVDLYVLIGDGSPDDILLSALLHVLDHRGVAGIDKPLGTGVAVLASSLAVILGVSKVDVARVMLVVDQNGKPLEDVFDEFLQGVKESGC